MSLGIGAAKTRAFDRAGFMALRHPNGGERKFRTSVIRRAFATTRRGGRRNGPVVIASASRRQAAHDLVDAALAYLSITLSHPRWLVERYVRRATTLLDVSRAQTGQLALLAAPVTLAEVVDEVVASLSPMAAHAGSAITVAVPDDLVLSCERLALDQILDNLITNAIKYGDAGPITVAADREAAEARIRVSDTGIGIGEADQARIFERFERAVADPGTAPTGFGVGLWLVRRLAEAMGGGVAVHSRPGEGATFTVTLPLHD